MTIDSARRGAIILSMLLSGCSAHAATGGSPTTNPTDIATSQPLGESRTLALADAVPIDQLQTPDNELNLSQRLDMPKQSLMFGSFDVANADGDVVKTTPIIAIEIDHKQRALAIDDDRLRDAEWSFVARGPKADEIWAVLDHSLDAPQRDLVLLHSVDGGATFNLFSLAKPSKWADYDSFAMSADGRGRVSVFVQSDDAHHRAGGFYHFATIDDGKSWSKPRFEPDAMSPADEMDDGDEPKVQKAALRVSAERVSAPSVAVSRERSERPRTEETSATSPNEISPSTPPGAAR